MARGFTPNEWAEATGADPLPPTTCTTRTRPEGHTRMSAITDPTSRLLAARIRTARLDEDLSLVQLAARLPEGHGTKLTGPLLGRVENGQRAVSVPELNAIACALGTAPELLMRQGQICDACGQEVPQ